MIWYQFKKNKAAMFGMFFLILLILVTIWAQFHYDYDKDVSATSTDVLAWPSAEHPLGTDHLGRDMLARLLYGGRWSLSIGLGVVCLNTIAGILYGAIATYIGGTVETLMMRFIEAIMMIPGHFRFAASRIARPTDTAQDVCPEGKEVSISGVERRVNPSMVS